MKQLLKYYLWIVILLISNASNGWSSSQYNKQTIRSQFSALWYSPLQSGHGININMLDNNGIVVIWYVYNNEGQPLWLLGQGTVTNESAELNVVIGKNGLFPPNFNSDEVILESWGTFEIQFINCDTIDFKWLPTNINSFSMGSLELKRLINTLGIESQCEQSERPAKPNNLQSWMVGNEANKFANLSQSGLLLMGGGSDVDAAFSTRVLPHIGANKDVVVLRTSGGSDYNDYLFELLKADSVETILVDTTEKANSDYVQWVISTAEFVWIAGGDQSDYLDQWEHTKLQSAIQSVYNKGGIVGGTSAGMALLAGKIYHPMDQPGAVSSEVINDFCHPSLNFHDSFLDIPLLQNQLTDTHFYERDRMGRAIVSLGHHQPSFNIIAASEATSIFIDESGIGVVDGDNEIYIIKESNNTQRLQLICGQKVIYSNLKRIKLINGQHYDFIQHSHNGKELEVSIDGTEDPFYIPANPY